MRQADQQQLQHPPEITRLVGPVIRMFQLEGKAQAEQEGVDEDELALGQRQDQPVHPPVHAGEGRVAGAEGGDVDDEDAQQGKAAQAIDGTDAVSYG
jgi:hypothetical protein